MDSSVSLSWYFDTSEEEIKEHMAREAEAKRVKEEREQKEMESRKDYIAELKAKFVPFQNICNEKICFKERRIKNIMISIIQHIVFLFLSLLFLLLFLIS